MLRAVRQQLESLSLAGLTHLARTPAGTAPRAAAPAPAVAPPVATPAPASTLPVPEPAAPAPDMPRPQKTSPPVREPKTLDLPAPTPAKAAAPAAAARSGKRGAAALAVLQDQVKACRRCAELASTRTQTVFGVGNPQARILFIGEAPGADEDAQGEPFVGRAGQLLNQIIEACRLKREDLYICNVLKCRPPNNRTPAEDECENCREFLLGQLAAVDPDYIVCWGAVAAQNLLSTKVSIGKLRGFFSEFGRAKVLCTYHPSYLLRNPPAKKDVWQDMQFLMADMGVDLKSKT